MYGDAPVYCVRCKCRLAAADLFCGACGAAQRPGLRPPDPPPALPAPQAAQNRSAGSLDGAVAFVGGYAAGAAAAAARFVAVVLLCSAGLVGLYFILFAVARPLVGVFVVLLWFSPFLGLALLTTAGAYAAIAGVERGREEQAPPGAGLWVLAAGVLAALPWFAVPPSPGEEVGGLRWVGVAIAWGAVLPVLTGALSAGLLAAGKGARAATAAALLGTFLHPIIAPILLLYAQWRLWAQAPRSDNAAARPLASLALAGAFAAWLLSLCVLLHVL